MTSDDGPRPRGSQIRGNDEILRRWRSGDLRSPGGSSDEVAQTLPLEEYVVRRDDDRDLRFRGRLVGINDTPSTAHLGTQVRIFVTAGGKIVTAVHQWQRGDEAAWAAQGNDGPPPIVREKFTAGVHEDPAAAIRWLVEDGRGRLGRSSAEAWKRACRAWPGLRDQDVEEVR